MEGTAGVADPDDIRPGQAEYERHRQYMTDEASAAVRGVCAADPDAQVVVCDAHAAFRNIVADRLDPRCTLVRGAPRPHGMLTGIDGAVDVVLFVGYHGRAGTARSNLAHTVSGATIAAVRFDGREVGEFAMNAALAASYGAASILATGDDTLCREAQADVPGIMTVEVKKAYGNRAVETLHPSVACKRIEAAAEHAVAHAPRTIPTADGKPVLLEVDLLRPHMIERAATIPGVEVRGAVTLAFAAPDVSVACDLVDLFAALATVR